MAAILESLSGQSGLALYVHIRNNSGQIWNGTSFVSWNSANWLTYSVAMTEQASSGYYNVTFPALIPQGKYSYFVYQRLGAVAAIGDTAMGASQIYWDGTNEIDFLSLDVDLRADQSAVTIGIVNEFGSTAVEQVNEQVIDVLETDTVSELSGVPSSTPTMKDILMFLFMAIRNKRTASTTQEKIYNAAGTAIATAVVSDSGVQFTKENFS